MVTGDRMLVSVSGGWSYQTVSLLRLAWTCCQHGVVHGFRYHGILYRLKIRCSHKVGTLKGMPWQFVCALVL